MTRIEVEHLSKQYGSKKVVRDLSFSLNEGDVLGFIGPNGAGKTTTMKMICGIFPPNSGTVRINGIDVVQSPREAKEQIGFLPENAPLHPSMTVESFLRYAACMRGISSRAERDRKICLAMDRCALNDVRLEEIEALSKGYKRRVCLAQAILNEPPVLILDEPTDGLDPNQKRQIRALISELKANTAVILSTHILEEVEAVCGRVLLLCGGESRFEGSREEFLARAQNSEDISALFARMTGEQS